MTEIAGAPTTVTPPRTTGWRRLPASFEGTTGVLIVIFLAMVIYPAFRIATTLFWSDGHFSAAAFRAFADSPGIGKTIGTTAIIVAISGSIAVVIGGTIAWLNERTDARMGLLTDLLPFLPFLTPPLAGAIGWVFLLSSQGGFINAVLRHLLGFVGIHIHSGPFNIYTYAGVIFVYVIYEVPFAFLMISNGLRNMDTQLEEQSRMCGASLPRTLFRVVLPSIAPSIAGAFLLVVWSGFGMYAVPQAIAQPANLSIMSVQIVNFVNVSFPPAYGPAAVLSLIVVGFVAIAWYAQSRVLRRSRHSTIGSRGSRGGRTPLGWAKWPVRCGLLAYVIVVTLFPLLANLLVALNGFWTSNINWDHLKFGVFHTAFSSDPAVAKGLVDSLEIAAAAATIGILVAAMISVVLTKSRSRLARATDGTVKLPVIVSHLVLAVGFILAFEGAPFHLGGTWWILFIAYVALYMPTGTLATDAVAAQVGGGLEEASRISGARTWRTYRKIYLPLMVGGLAVGWALIFVRVIGDLEVSALLAGPANPTIGSETLQLYNNASFGSVAALSLMLMIITTFVVVTIFSLARRRASWSLSGVVGHA